MYVGVGEDSHRFLENSNRPCYLGGVCLPPSIPGFDANSDGDVMYHALCNAISSITGELVLGGVADTLCQEGVTNSTEYLLHAMRTLHLQNKKVVHVAFSLECKRPLIKPYLAQMKENIARHCSIDPVSVGITATSGEGLTDVGKGLGVRVLCVITIRDEEKNTLPG